METPQKKEKKLTTVSVDAVIRDVINQEADRLGLSQRQMVSRLWETFKLQQEKARSPDKPDTEDLIEGIYEALEKVLKRDDRIIAFIKEQEKIFLNPLLNSSQSTTETLKQLVEVLSNLE
jgi:hypothetical protein